MKTIITIGSFVIMIFLASLWIKIDQLLLPAYLLMPAFLIIITFLLFLYFLIAKPENVKRFAFYLSLAVFITSVLLTILQHVIITYDFNLVWKKTIIIWTLILILPNLIGLGYLKFVKKQPMLTPEVHCNPNGK